MLRKTLLTIAVGVAALAFGASTSKAVEIDLGGLTGAAGACTHAAGDEGLVCGSTLTFPGTAAGTLTATAFNASPNVAAGTAFLTFKPINAFNGAPANGLSESGLGENTAASPAACTDGTDCEINGTHSVGISSSVALGVADVLIGSAQPGESFNLFTGSAYGSLTEIVTGFMPTAANCPNSVCTFNFSPATIVAVQNAGAGDVLLTSVSTPNVPEPASLALLGAALVGLASPAALALYNHPTRAAPAGAVFLPRMPGTPTADFKTAGVSCGNGSGCRGIFALPGRRCTMPRSPRPSPRRRRPASRPNRRNKSRPKLFLAVAMPM
jgi:hypothetical protein